MLLLVYKQEGTSTCFYTHIHTHIYAYIYAAVFSSEAESNKSFSTQECISIDVKPCFEIESWPRMPTSEFGELKVRRPQTRVLHLGKTFCHSVSLPWYLDTSALTCVAPLGSVPDCTKGSAGGTPSKPSFGKSVPEPFCLLCFSLLLQNQH